MIIKGNSVGCVRSNWNQTDPNEADYIIGREKLAEALQSAADAAENKVEMRVATVTLKASSWSSNSQKVAVTGMLADESKCHAQPTPATTSHAMYYDCDVHGTKQEDGYLTFGCEETPTSDLTVRVAIFIEGVRA